ncbi:ribonuclease G [Methylohalomonas lacus]|uniref:Ribonuclease G n=1 Tax=Methylohalomonas lacus TaxID=398773 RepID=A0AAE3L0N3_9GAMM|nr:Rne/Rng family ribonuclease [Methylohalomonas lacus]MCS3902320.1 ribonuclease G [Methylohalomonas lacus]
MSSEILINVTPQETRVAVVDNGVLQEVYIERDKRRGIVGNIYKGRVSRVLPGMQAAFIDMGLARTGFLHRNDLTDPDSDEAPDNTSNLTRTPAIEHLLNEGDEVLVQVLKDPIGSKGARLTTRLAIPSRYLVLIPDCPPSIGISQRIEDETERERLRGLVYQYQSGVIPIAVGDHDNLGIQPRLPPVDVLNNGGFIVRTAAEGVNDDKIRKDIDFLCRLWHSIQGRIDSITAPGTIYEDLPLFMRTLRDLVDTETEKVRIDSRESYDRLADFARRFIPEFVDRIELYTGEHPILDLYSVEDEIQKSLGRRVELKSGGHLYIDQTEAMTTIDINTGAFVGHRNLEETIFKTNLEATHAIARQLRLRNLGGIIIVDFIDMQDTEHQRQVLRTLDKHLERDHSKVAISEVTSLGLVQITRKRTRESLEHVLCEPCPTCHGRGSVKTAESVCYEIFREILREVRQFDAKKLLVIASQPVVDMLLDDESTSVAELEAFIGRSITFQVETLYDQEQYDIVLL